MTSVPRVRYSGGVRLFRRYFTPAEANSLLPELRARLGAAAEAARAIRELLGERMPNLDDEDKERVERWRSIASKNIDHIREAGVEVKGLETGLLDFPALRNGEQVFLCWQVGEESLEWWHPISSGFPGRRRVSDDPSARWQWCN